MKPIVGVICEYDPFHLGHRRHFELIRAALPDALIVCLMSGCFTQRGMCTLHAPGARARAALEAGADLVLELPCAFSVRDAEHFALGGVQILTSLGFVTHLSFGSEDALDTLRPAAMLLEHPTPAFEQAIKAKLAQGSSFAAAQGAALDLRFGAPGAKAASPWQKPNNILALCYLRAIERLQSPLQPLPVKREGDYHAPALKDGAFPSATAVRAAFLEGAFAQADAACGYALPRDLICRPDALDSVLLYKLRTMSAEALSALPDCTEGLENRLKACAMRCSSREALLDALKTRRYARARLSRLCCHALLDVTAELLKAHPTPEYVRLLGLRRNARELTGLLKQSSLPVIAKAADGDRQNPLWQLDLRAYDLWALGAGLPAGFMLTQGVRVV